MTVGGDVQFGKFEVDGGLWKHQGTFLEIFVRTGAGKVSVLMVDHKKFVKVSLKGGRVRGT